MSRRSTRCTVARRPGVKMLRWPLPWATKTSSLLSYLFPSERAGKIFYDGMGPDLADIQGESVRGWVQT